MKLFLDDLVEDDREPLLSFAFPGIEGEFGLLAPRWELWRQIVVSGLLINLVHCFCAILVYYFIVSQRSTTKAYLFGWLVMLPFVTWLPFQMIEFFEFKNLIIKMVPSNIFIAVVPRTIEAMYNTAPPGVEDSLLTYMEYYAAGSPPIRDPKTKRRMPVCLRGALCTVIRLATYYHLLCLSLSIMMNYQFAPFESPVVMNNFHFNTDLLHPGHLGNAYAIGLHNFFHLGFAMELLTLSENVKGWSTKPPFRNPVFKSRSPTDFWGKRWNRTIHEVLKGGAFKPARKYFSAPIAMALCFLLSGVIHDFVYACAFYAPQSTRDPDTGVCEDCYSVPIYKLTLFFLWNGMMMMLEKPLANKPPFKWISKNLPVPIISTLVLLTTLPVSHWFTGDWVMGGSYEAMTQALWIVKRVDY